MNITGIYTNIMSIEAHDLSFKALEEMGVKKV